MLFESSFGELRGNVRWKARGQFSIRHNWTFPAISHGWDVISGNLSKSAFFEGSRSLWCQKTRVTALSCGIKISTVHCLVLSQSTRVTDGRTDQGRLYSIIQDSMDRRTDGRTELRLPRLR